MECICCFIMDFIYMKFFGRNVLGNRLASVIYALPNICKQAELCTCHQLLHGVDPPPPPHPHQSLKPYLIFVNKQSYAHAISFSMGLTCHPLPIPISPLYPMHMSSASSQIVRIRILTLFYSSQGPVVQIKLQV